MKKLNFDTYLDQHLRNPDFVRRYQQDGEAWDIALSIAELRERAGLSQKELARRVGSTQ